MILRLRQFAVATLLGLAAAATGYAACSGPSGLAGQQVYAGNLGTMAFCDGTNWVSMAGGVSQTINIGGTTGATTLAALTDVNVTGAATGNILAYNGSTWVVSSTSAASSTPGGSSGQVQYNNGGAFAGDSNLTYASGLLTVTGTVTATTHAGTTATFTGLGTFSTGSFGGLTVTGGTSLANVSATNLQVGHSTLTCSSGISGTIRYSTASNTLQVCNSTGWVSLSSSTTGGGNASVGGATTQIQFNDNGSLNGTANLTYTSSSGVVSVSIVSTTYMQIQSATTVYACTTGLTGTLRYTSGTVQVCDGASWGNVGIGVPTGTIMAFEASSCPSGWSEYTNARGRFLRGIDNGAGNDPDGTRAAGSTQADMLGTHGHSVTDPGHSHYMNQGPYTGGGNYTPPGVDARYVNNAQTNGATTGITIANAGGAETRAKNVAVTFCRYNGYASGSFTNTSSTVAGSTGQLQYNTSGALDASTNLTWANASSLLTIAGTTSSTNLYANAASFTTLTVGGVAITGSGSGQGDRISSTGVASGAGLGAAVASYGTVSFTLGGTAGAAYLHPTLGLVAPGVSTTGPISATAAYISGSVGIGTSTPATPLDVLGGASTPALNLGAPSTNTSGARLRLTSNIGSTQRTTEAFNLDNSGNLGVTNSSAGGMYINSVGNGATVFRNGAGYTFSMVVTPGKVSVGGTTYPLNVFDVQGAATIGTAYAGLITAPTNGLLVQGNVGIATTTPSSTLDVSGTLKVTGSTGSEACVSTNLGLMRRNPTSGRMQLCK